MVLKIKKCIKYAKCSIPHRINISEGVRYLYDYI
jgi:hypothetical protein